jgi:SAM-dependent methyltransferase
MEFTGERVVPGQVDPDLWQEHVSRYEFAWHYTRLLIKIRKRGGLRILDAGCGAGYGTALLAEHRGNEPGVEVVGVDASEEAVAWATEHYQAANARFVRGDATALPDFHESYDVVVAFEVIEHLADPESFLLEVQRLLRPNGVLLVSTPNRRFYTEERGFHNPFHTREYDGPEFFELLRQRFAHIEVLEQNHGPAISFTPQQGTTDQASFAVARAKVDDEPHFFLAICSMWQVRAEAFVYLPESGNVLRERERHIHKLEQNLASFQEQTRRELAERREWAKKLEAELHEKGEAISGLQGELEERRAWADRLNLELREKAEYIVQLQRESEERIAELGDRLAERQKEVERLESEVGERAAWAAALNEEIATARARLLEAYAELDRREQGRAAQVSELEQELERREQARAMQTAELERELERREQARLAQVGDLERELVSRADWAHRLNDHIATLEAELARLRVESADLAAIRATRWHRAGNKLGFTPKPAGSQP